MPKGRGNSQKYRKNYVLLDAIRKDVLGRIRDNNTRSLGVHLPDVTNYDKIKYINYQPDIKKYRLGYRDPIYFPVNYYVRKFANTRQAAEVQQFIRNEVSAISNKLIPVNDVALHNTKTTTIDPKTNKRLPDFVKFQAEGRIIVKKYDEYVFRVSSPVALQCLCHHELHTILVLVPSMPVGRPDWSPLI